LIAAQRAAGVASLGTLNAQLRPSALRPVLAAAKAALVTLMQQTISKAAAISIRSLMATSCPGLIRSFGLDHAHHTIKSAHPSRKTGPVLA
jgi:hypothetical protein